MIVWFILHILLVLIWLERKQFRTVYCYNSIEVCTLYLNMNYRLFVRQHIICLNSLML